MISLIIILCISAGISKAIADVCAEEELFFNSKLKNWNPGFWLKDWSFRRKYKGFLFSTVLVWTTDGWHLMNMIYGSCFAAIAGLSFLLPFEYTIINALLIIAGVKVITILSGHIVYEYLT